MRNFPIIFLLSLAILALVGSGCTQLDAKVNLDLTGVSSVAAAAGDTMLQACVAKLQPILAAKQASTGILSKAAALYEVRKVFGAEGECQGVTAEVATTVLMSAPFVGPLL